MEDVKKKFWSSTISPDFQGALYRVEWWWPFYGAMLIWCACALWAVNGHPGVLSDAFVQRYALPRFVFLSHCTHGDQSQHLGLLFLASVLAVAAAVVQVFVLLPYMGFYLEMKRIFAWYFLKNVRPLGYIRSFRVFSFLIFTLLGAGTYFILENFFVPAPSRVCPVRVYSLMDQVLGVFFCTWVAVGLAAFCIGWGAAKIGGED